ncbi:MAG: hypothetical protein FWD71_03470 [Oscillospiraceae bacterium]|nr:hypothetical protein [Oscillospiraceae bacterium]
MKAKAIIIISIIIGLITIALAWLSSSESIGIELPFYIWAAPSVLWCCVFLPIIVSKKKDSDK